METLLEMPRTPKDKPLAPLRERRKDKHWSVTTLAELSGVDPATIWHIETSRDPKRLKKRAEKGLGPYTPHRDTMKAIAVALDLPVKAIAEFVDE